MACIYFYNNHQFNSEIELDDFLLEKELYYKEFKDTVFKATNALLVVLKRLGEINKETKELYNKYKEFYRKSKFNEDGEPDINERPYVGVNRFLGELVIDDKQLLMQFRPDEYWSRRYEKWAEGDFTKDELDTFKITQGTRIQKLILGKNSKGETITNYTKMRELMEKRWKHLALIGTAVHNVLQLYFTYLDNMYGYEREDVKDYIKKNLEPKNKKIIESDLRIDDIIEYAQKLRESLEQELGEGLLFMPEFMASSDVENPNTGKTDTILGIIDLVIIDSSGRTHILDYKTSIKEYKDFGIAKQRAYAYQMATYQRILDRYGINVSEGSLIVAPIQITGFAFDDEDKYKYDSITYTKIIDVINSHLNPTNWAKIETFLPPIISLDVTTEKLLETTSKFMAKCWPAYGNVGMITEKGVIKYLEKLGLLKKPENGIYEYKPYGSSENSITAETPLEFVEKVLKYRKSLIPRKVKTTSEIKRLLKKAIKEQSSNVNWPSSSAYSTGVSATWLRDILSKYCNERWEVVDMESLESYGIIQLLNKDTAQVDYIKISGNELTTNYNSYLDKNDPIKNRKGLANFQIDLVEQSKTESLMLEGAIGNIELMEMMAIINQMKGLSTSIIGNIQVINPYDAVSVSASNEELKYCFSIMCNYVQEFENNFDNGNIKLASRYLLLTKQFANILALGETRQWKDNYKYFENFKSCTSILDLAIVNPEDLIDVLEEMKKLLQNDVTVKPIISRTYNDSEHLNSDLISLYNNIELALATLKGIKLRQQLKDHGQWFEDVYHLSATYFDNPGNLSSETLNVITKKLTEALLNTRDEILRKKNEMKKVFDKYKEAKGWNYLKENVGFNLVNLYQNLYTETPEGDLLFKNIKNLDNPERELLEYVLEEINKERHPDWTKEIRDYKRDTYDIEYYRVPLARGDSDSIVSTKGLLSLLKEKLQNWDPRVILRKAREKAEGIYEAQTKKDEKILNLYKMTNMFDRGNESTETRIKIIQKNGIHTFERNLEYLLLKHSFAYAQLRNIDKVFPLIKAATIHLTNQGAYLNRSFSLDIKFIEEYITNKIHKKSIVNPNTQEIMAVVNEIKQAASKLTLAFAPVQMFYQPLQGLWLDISLMIRKPDGKNSFTFNHFKTAFKLVYSDLFKFSGNPTLCSLLNELYALNDMDINTYVERITKTKKGIWNLDNMMFKFASRPDFYNRMSIFISLMLGDGCLEAHSVVDGKLVYDWTKDKRFSKYAENPKLKTNDIEFNKLKSLYYTVAKLFESEGATVEINGTVVPFKVDMNNPMPLPRAYTNQQAESMKSLSDDIYGYYSEEKKSLVMSTMVGGMWLQFKTYWSGKKNQYLQSGGVRLRGTWEHYEENGEKYYYQVDANGNPKYNDLEYPPLSESLMKEKNIPLIAPVMKWKGLWLEGVLVTLGDIGLKILKDPKNLVNHFRNKWNESDEDLRRCYLSNMKQFIYDITMFAIVGSILGSVLGGWLDDLEEENKGNDDFITGLYLAAANVAVMSVKNSFLDFNFIESVGSPVGQWTPFAIEWAGRLISNIMKVASGDEDIWDGALNVAGASKQLKFMFDAIKPEMFRTEREGGTWVSATVRKNREERGEL